MIFHLERFAWGRVYWAWWLALAAADLPALTTTATAQYDADRRRTAYNAKQKKFKKILESAATSYDTRQMETMKSEKPGLKFAIFGRPNNAFHDFARHGFVRRLIR